MDYGPFGWMDASDPFVAKWTGSGEHFAFANQPGAGLANFAVLAASVAPLLAGEEDEASDIVREIEGVMETAVSATWRRKLGLDDDVSAADVAKLWDYGLEPLMRAAECDYVVCFRQLADVALAGDADAHRRCTARAVGGRVLRAARRGRAREMGRLDSRMARGDGRSRRRRRGRRAKNQGGEPEIRPSRVDARGGVHRGEGTRRF